MDTTYLNKLYDQLTEQLDEIDVLEPIERLKAALGFIEEGLLMLKVHIEQKPFSDLSEEIEFKKSLEPRFQALKLYELWLFGLNQYQPLNMTREAYFKNELIVLQWLFDKHPFHYHYYRMGLSNLDAEFYSSAVERTFVPPMDGLIAQFMAAERLQGHINNVIEPDLFSAGGKSVIKWTGDTINLVEILYAICLTGQVNHGNITPVQLGKELEFFFGVSLGRPHRRFTEIARRKRLSNTKYLDDAVRLVNEKVDKMNE